MSEERPGKHQWAPVVAAIITASAVVAAAYISADAKRQVEALKEQNETLKKTPVISQEARKPTGQVGPVKDPLDSKAPASVRAASADTSEGSALRPKDSSAASPPIVPEPTPEPTPILPKPQPTLLREVTTEEFNFKFSNCARSTSKVRCEFFVTDLVGDRNFYMDSGQIIDANGNVYTASRFYLGAEEGPFLVNSTLTAGAATKAALDIESVRSSTSLIEVLELKGHSRRSKVVVRFPKIPL